MTAGTVDHDARKVVTVLFADITRSTTLGRHLDPESLQQLLSHYFADMQRVVERHGGTVGKFIGDAVMAVFGLPRAHEDDALRAVRAAAEMRETLAALNEQFASSWGVTVAVRTGVNTGEVLAHEPDGDQALVVGDAVNVAARLEQVAQPGEILIGEETYRLVREAVRAEHAGPLELRGITASATAWRLHEVIAHAPGWSRRLDSPLVDRTRELAQLEDAFERVAGRNACELATVIAPAGVGKSRLTAELLARVAPRVTVLQGRCLPYGEGITFWPLVSVLSDAIAIGDEDGEPEARRKLTQLFAGGRELGDADIELVCDALAPLLGFGRPNVGIQETYWAVRKLLERLGGGGAVVVVFDDIHWAETTFLDLLEYLADGLASAPVLLLCQARPELLEIRPGWTTAKPNACVVGLPPLSPTDTTTLIRGLVGGADLPANARARIADVAEGNPLFVEETVRMLVDDGLLQAVEGGWAVAGDLSAITIPPTIHALLTARLDRLEPEERAVIERGAIMGRSFWWGAVSELSPSEARASVSGCLRSLVRKQLIETHRSELPRQDAFRFTHILVRDAAYEAIPKSRRADMHQRVAGWITERMRDVPGDYEEIIGYHFEQAHRALAELGPPSDRTRELARRAAVPLASAGERAFARGDMPAAVNLLGRAAGLLPAHDAVRLELLPELAFALMETAAFERLAAVASEMVRTATETRDRRLQAHATVINLWIRVFTNPQGWADEAEPEARRAIATFEELGDERGLARAWSLVGVVECLYARFATSEEAWWRAIDHAGRAGNRRDLLEALSWVPGMILAGPVAAEEGIRRCRDVLGEAQGDKKAMASALFCQAVLEAGLERFDSARQLCGRARAMLEEVAVPAFIGGPLAQAVGWVELLAGEPAAAERELRHGYGILTSIGEVTFLSTAAGILAEALYAQGKDDEAERFTHISEESAGAEDVYSQVLWRSVRAKALARKGELREARRLADEAAAFLEATDSLHLRWHALMSRAETLRLDGRLREAEAALEAAIRVAEAKGNHAAARLGRDAQFELRAPRTRP
jgi:class 3 adenylate cyclase/tetratricopeptide (TPR) repeat protein